MRSRDITSRDNPAVKQYVQLANSKKERYALGQFVTEGYKLTAEAFSAGCRPVALFATEEALERYDGLQDISLDSESFYHISAPVADKLAQSVSPQGVFAVFGMLDNIFHHVKMEPGSRLLLLSALQDPGNVGTILRTAAAFGADGVVLSADCPDPYSPKVLRSAMGGAFKIHWEVAGSLEEKIGELRRLGVPVYAAALTGDAVSVRGLPLESGCAVVIGNEGNGLAPALIGLCDKAAIIPMEPESESLNAAMAAGIFLWEMARGR